MRPARTMIGAALALAVSASGVGAAAAATAHTVGTGATVDTFGAAATDPTTGHVGTTVRPGTERVGALAPFRTEPLPLVQVPAAQLPFNAAGFPLAVTNRPVDRAGIVQYRDRLTGRLYDHPVVQSGFVLGWLASYEQTHDRRYLAKATQLGHRILLSSTTSRGARFYPYRFDFPLHGERKLTLKAPWYSGMAQGQVLAMLLRLHRATGDARWQRAARETFASFLLPRVNGRPWVSDVDAQGRLWLEEYPDRVHSDRAYNGHNFAVFGLYEYWWATQDARAAALLRGSLSATLAYAPAIRRPGQLSRYCLTHDVRSPGYHGIHVRQLYVLGGLTGDRRFGTWAGRFLADAPAAYTGGPGRMAAGAARMLTVDTAGAVSSRRTVTLPRARDVAFDHRARLGKEPGVWLRVAAGPLRGSWVREQAGRAFLKGLVEPYRLSPARTVTFAAGRRTGYTVAREGVLRPVRTVTLPAGTTAPATDRSVVGGAPAVRISQGPLAGLLVALDDRARLS